MIGQDGTSYEGEFIQGVRQGFGRQRLPNGDIYEGMFVQGAKHGKGKLIIAHTHEVYIGQWRNDHREGLGSLQNV
jgi:hypothetical protein